MGKSKRAERAPLGHRTNPLRVGRGMHIIDMGQWPAAMIVTRKRRAYERFMRRYHSPDHPWQPFPEPGGGLSVVLHDGTVRATIVIAVGQCEDRDELSCTLAHEATHAMRWILEHVGEAEPGTETQAYLVEHIVKGALRVL